MKCFTTVMMEFDSQNDDLSTRQKSCILHLRCFVAFLQEYVSFAFALCGCCLWRMMRFMVGKNNGGVVAFSVAFGLMLICDLGVIF